MLFHAEKLLHQFSSDAALFRERSLVECLWPPRTQSHFQCAFIGWLRVHDFHFAVANWESGLYKYTVKGNLSDTGSLSRAGLEVVFVR